MAVFTDQTHRQVEISSTPLRIISTVPSQTELLYDLGLEELVVGITAYCVHPKGWLEEKQVIGGTKNLNIDLIRSLKPDLIIGNKEENIKEQIEELAEDFPVWLSDIATVDDALEMIVEVGKITNTSAKARGLVEEIQIERKKLQPSSSPKRTAYFIWNDPMMVAGKDTFINTMMKAAGLINVFDGERYPQVSEAMLQKENPDLIILSSEPYRFTTRHLHEFAALCPQAKIKIMDGEMFSWYGSRMAKAFRYFNQYL